MKTTLVYPDFLADSGYHAVFNPSTSCSDRNRRGTTKYLLDQDFSAVFFRYLKTYQIFSLDVFI